MQAIRIINRRQKGSFTLEAVVVLPLVAIFFVTLMMFFRVLQIQTRIEAALVSTSREVAVESALYDGELVGFATAEVLFRADLAGDELIDRYVRGGNLGITLIGSDLSDDYVDLCADYEITLPFTMWGIGTLEMEQHSKSRKWTGKNVGSAKEEDPYVYYTDYGSVYHLTSECTHLDLSIRAVDYAAVSAERSSNGARYNPCHCAKGNLSGKQVYITTHGIEYHASLECKDLTRNVHMARRSTLGGLRACSKCGG